MHLAELSELPRKIEEYLKHDGTIQADRQEIQGRHATSCTSGAASPTRSRWRARSSSRRSPTSTRKGTRPAR